MRDLLRLWFVVSYGLGFAFFLTSILRFQARRLQVEQRVGPLPSPPALITWLIPPVILLTKVGLIREDWILVRALGVSLSLYAMVVIPWATQVLGRSYAPGAALLQGQSLVDSGPFQFMRHPIYSAVAVLWLGAALGTLNWILLGLWPLLVLALIKSARTEERLLRAKFGEAYDAFAVGKGGLFPRF